MARQISERVRRIGERIENLEAMLPEEAISEAELEAFEALALMMTFACFARLDVPKGDAEDAERTFASLKPAMQTLLREMVGMSGFNIDELKQRIEDRIMPMRPEDIAALDAFNKRASRRDQKRMAVAVIGDVLRNHLLEPVEPGLPTIRG